MSSDRKSVQVNVRVGVGERELWKAAAEVEGVPVGEWLRGLASARADELLNCGHVRVRSYPSAGAGRPGGAWCLDCGAAV